MTLLVTETSQSLPSLTNGDVQLAITFSALSEALLEEEPRTALAVSSDGPPPRPALWVGAEAVLAHPCSDPPWQLPLTRETLGTLWETPLDLPAYLELLSPEIPSTAKLPPYPCSLETQTPACAQLLHTGVER